MVRVRLVASVPTHSTRCARLGQETLLVSQPWWYLTRVARLRLAKARLRRGKARQGERRRTLRSAEAELRRGNARCGSAKARFVQRTPPRLDGGVLFANIDPMHYVYILNCNDGGYYHGCTNNLQDRLDRHRKGHIPATKDRLPVKLEAYFAFRTKYTAYNFEKYLKSGSGRAFLKRHLASE